MKDYVKQLLGETVAPGLKYLLVREYLQARILQALQEAGVFMDWVFRGGTALRFLHSLPRFSEDLDFALVEPKRDSGFSRAMEKVKSALLAENYFLSIRQNTQKPVMTSLVKFEGLLFELGLSPRRTQILSFKVEVDTNPPAGAGLMTSIVRRHVLLNLFHHDRATLFAGKLAAVLSRPYVKGRDLYDLIWYLSDRSWPEPNIPYLQSALGRSGWKGPKIEHDNWRSIIADRLGQIRWKDALEDVRPFLEKAREVDFLTEENCLNLLSSR